MGPRKIQMYRWHVCYQPETDVIFLLKQYRENAEVEWSGKMPNMKKDFEVLGPLIGHCNRLTHCQESERNG